MSMSVYELFLRMLDELANDQLGGTNDKSTHSPKNTKKSVLVPEDIHFMNKDDIKNIKQNDELFIRSCEEKLKTNSLNKYIQLRNKLRQSLEKDIDPDVLFDFKTIVRIMDHEKPNDENIETLNKLLQKYN